MKDPRIEAYNAVERIMEKGSAKDGKNESWRDMPRHYHLLKASRHVATGLMIEFGVIQPDGDNHFELAITRLAFVLCQ